MRRARRRDRRGHPPGEGQSLRQALATPFAGACREGDDIGEPSRAAVDLLQDRPRQHRLDLVQETVQGRTPHHPWKDRREDAQAVKLGQRLDRVSFAHHLRQFVPQPFPREAREHPFLHRHPNELPGLGGDLEAQAGGEAHGADGAGRVVEERQRVEHTDLVALQVALTAEEVEQIAEPPGGQVDGHRVDGEVAPVEILAHRGRLDLGQRRGRAVELGARRGDVQPDVAVQDGPPPSGTHRAGGSVPRIGRPDARRARLRCPRPPRPRPPPERPRRTSRTAPPTR